MFSKTILLAAFLFSFHLKSFAQTTWDPIGLDVVGHNTMNGVNASYQQNTCNGQDVVYIKFTNNNNYSVELNWDNAVFTQDLQWISKEDAADKKTIILAANQNLQGDCPDA